LPLLANFVVLRDDARDADPAEERQLRPVSAIRERYALREQDADLAVFDAKSWGKRPVKISLPSPGSIEPGLLLCSAFVVHRLAATADSSAAGATAAVSSSSSG